MGPRRVSRRTLDAAQAVIRPLLLVLLAVAAIVAYPWIGLLAGAVLGLALATAVTRGRRHRRPQSALTPGTSPVSADRRRALQAAWREVNRIERAHGLPPTPKPRI